MTVARLVRIMEPSGGTVRMHWQESDKQAMGIINAHVGEASNLKVFGFVVVTNVGLCQIHDIAQLGSAKNIRQPVTRWIMLQDGVKGIEGDLSASGWSKGSSQDKGDSFSLSSRTNDADNMVGLEQLEARVFVELGALK